MHVNDMCIQICTHHSMWHTESNRNIKSVYLQIEEICRKYAGSQNRVYWIEVSSIQHISFHGFHSRPFHLNELNTVAMHVTVPWHGCWLKLQHNVRVLDHHDGRFWLISIQCTLIHMHHLAGPETHWGWNKIVFLTASRVFRPWRIKL